MEIYRCISCDKIVKSTVNHMLFECEGLANIRNEACEVLKTKALPGTVHSLKDMTNHEKTKFMLSGMQTKYIREFEVSYNAILSFIVTVYNAKVQLLS